MTYQEIVKQTKTLRKEEQQKLAYYVLFSLLEKNKRNNFLQLFNNLDIGEDGSKKDISKILKKYKGKIKSVWADEDAQIYVNNLRNDEREF